MIVVAIGAFLLLLVVAYLIARPLFAPEEPAAETEESELLEGKQRLLTEIRELDLDFATGKLAEDDYRQLRAASLAKAAATMQALAEAGERVREAGPAPERSGLTPAAGEPTTSIDEELERAITARKRTLETHGCPGCGAVFDPADRFCRSCGVELATAATR